jgi:hypothetical protein
MELRKPYAFTTAPVVGRRRFAVTWRPRHRKLAGMAHVPRMTLAAVVLAAIPLAACAPARTVEAVRILDDLATGAGPSALKEGTPAPQREAITYAVAGRVHAADRYRPGTGEIVAARLVLVPGAAPAGRGDPRLVAFATTLARARFEVWVPEIPSLRTLRLGAGDIGAVSDALAAAATDPPGRSREIGVMALSYASGPALIAALEPAHRNAVRFLLTVGGYHSITEVVRFFTTGYYRDSPDAPWRHRAPNAYGKWVFARANANRLDDQLDAGLLAWIAERRMDDPEADVSWWTRTLGPEGASVYRLLTNRDPDRTPSLIAALPEAIRANLAALDVSRRDLSALRARLILVHGADDPIIPESESRALAAAVPPGRAELHIVGRLAHVDLGGPGLSDVLTLGRAVYSVLAERDAMAAGR